MQLCVGPHQAEAVSKPPGELSECGDHLLPQLSEQPRRVLPDQDPWGDVGEDPLGAGHHPLVLLGPGPPPRPPPPGGVEHGEAGAGAHRPGHLYPGPPEQLGQPALPGLGVGVEEGDAGPVAPQVRVPVPELGPAHVEQWRSAGDLVNQSEESFKLTNQRSVFYLVTPQRSAPDLGNYGDPLHSYERVFDTFKLYITNKPTTQIYFAAVAKINVSVISYGYI